MLPFNTFNEEVAARVKAIDRRVRRLETLEESGGCLNIIEDILLTAPAASMPFDDIPQNYKHLWLWTDLLNSGAAGDSGFLRLNGDSGLSYTWIRFDMGVGAGVHIGQGGDSLDTEIQLRANTIGGGHHEVNIIDYTATGKKRQVLWKGGGGFGIFAGDPGPSFNDLLVLGRGTWENTVDAITSISIGAFTVFDAGSRATLYGLC